MLYIDIFFFINTAMDFILLVMLALWKQEPLFWKGIMLASVIGGIWACIVVVFPTEQKQWFCIGTIYPIVYSMVTIAFPHNSNKIKRKNTVTFLLISWSLAGLLDFVYYQIWLPGEVGSVQQRLMILLGCFGAAFLGVLFYRKNQQTEWEDSVIYSVEVEVCGRKEIVQALWDSGNRLCTMTGEPVCIVDEKVMKRLMDEQWELLENWASSEGTFLAQIGFQLISYHCIGKEEDILPAIRGKCITIQKEDETIVIKNPIIGYCSSKLQREGAYEMILPSSYGIQLLKKK